MIIATDEHPFWVPDLRVWVDAVDLAPGTWLQTSSGTWVQVSAVQAWTQPARVHNLTVQGVHTFYVAAGGLDLLNHNCGSVPIYRTPKVDNLDYEINNGPNSSSHQDGDRSVYFGERSVAAEYQGRGSFANGSIRYDMKPEFLNEFSDTAFRYDRQGPGGSPRIEFVVPVGRVGRFNELTVGRTWEPRGGV